MRKILAMLLSVMLLLTAAVAETSAPYAPETVLPLVANNRPYRDFARGAISSSEDAIESVAVSAAVRHELFREVRSCRLVCHARGRGMVCDGVHAEHVCLAADG